MERLTATPYSNKVASGLHSTIKSARSLSLIIPAMAIISSPSYATQPPDVVVSDPNFNTAMGTDALRALSGAGVGANTAAGWEALSDNTSGNDNTAVGTSALQFNTVGSSNTAVGSAALTTNSSGMLNTAIGFTAANSNSTGSSNTAVGAYALDSNDAGSNNTATGVFALGSNHGSDNTASGTDALELNFNGQYNTAMGSSALTFNDGNYNTAAGYLAMYHNSSGADNTAIGVGAMLTNTSGGNNIALGAYAGAQLTTGFRNIDIGNVGVKGDAGTIRIGTIGSQTATYVAGIAGHHLSGAAAVYITPSGQLGVLASSNRFKTAIEPMGQRTGKLDALRPVTFRLKSDPKGTIQYGLIAEEVAKVYPELVVTDGKGRIDSVRYDELAPMLLNEMQQLKTQVAELKRANDQLQAIVGKYAKDEQLAAR